MKRPTLLACFFRGLPLCGLLFLLLALAACGGGGGSAQPTPTGSQGACSVAVPCDTTPSPQVTPTQVGPAAPGAAAATPVSDAGSVPVSGTPACTAPASLTPPSTEGPYYSPNPPENSNLAGDLPGQRLLLSGYVLDTNCQPVAGARVDFWQADSAGQYDNAGYTLRGYQITAADGSYRLETVVPGQYPGRTEHIHVKVQAPGGPELTTQLYFPESKTNQSDRIYLPALLIQVAKEDPQQVEASFNFVIEK